MTKKLLYPAITVHRNLPVNYDTMLPSKTDFIIAEEKFREVYSITLTNAYVSPYGVVFKNGRVINESVYNMFKPIHYYGTFYKKIFLNKVKKVTGKVAVCHNAYYQNYYHFMADCLPRLYAIKDQAKDLTLILNKKSTRFIDEYVALFDFKDIVYINDDEIIKADEVVFTTQICRGLAYNPIIIKEINAWVKEKLNIKAKETSNGKVAFLSREFAQYRRTTKDKEILRYLREKNVSIFNFENVSIKEQVAAFAPIEKFISIHGAGMVNTMFSDNCTFILDLIHDQHPDDAFYNLACVYNTDFYYMQCPGVHKNLNPNVNDLDVDFEKFVEICEQYVFN